MKTIFFENQQMEKKENFKLCFFHQKPYVKSDIFQKKFLSELTFLSKKFF